MSACFFFVALLIWLFVSFFLNWFSYVKNILKTNNKKKKMKMYAGMIVNLREQLGCIVRMLV